MEQAGQNMIKSSQVYLLQVVPEGQLLPVLLEIMNSCHICKSALMKLLGAG